ncbi:MAG: hypothetical protein CMM07_04695 [Rhodopirellula sp.]|nr:hypothetical protein [Rhodopirellula sp.]
MVFVVFSTRAGSGSKSRQNGSRVVFASKLLAWSAETDFFCGRLHQIAHLWQQPLDDIWRFSVFFRAVSQFWHGG